MNLFPVVNVYLRGLAILNVDLLRGIDSGPLVTTTWGKQRARQEAVVPSV